MKYLKKIVVDEYKSKLSVDIDIGLWNCIITKPDISMQTNGQSCGTFGCARLESWCIHRRFPTKDEFRPSDDDGVW